MIENLERYRPLLLQIYQERCGDSISYYDVEDKFAASLDQPYLYSLLTDNPYSKSSIISSLTKINPIIAFPFISYYFQDYLAVNGKNCSDKSFLAWANSWSQNIVAPATDGVSRFVAWRLIIDQATTELKELKSLLLATPPNDDFIVVRARRAAIILERMAFTLEFWNFSSTYYGITGELLAAETKTMVNAFRSYVDQIIDNFPSHLLSIHNPRLNRENAVWFFLMKWEFFNDPLRWISDVYFRHLNKRKIGVEVIIGSQAPDVEPENPAAIRRLVSQIVEIAVRHGSPENPVVLRFDIDEEKGELVIESKDLSKIVGDPLWNGLFDTLVELKALSQMHFESVDGKALRVFIPFSFRRMSSPPYTPSGQTGGGPLASPSDLGMPPISSAESPYGAEITGLEAGDEYDYCDSAMDGAEEYFSPTETDFMPAYEYPFEYAAVFAP